MTRSLLSLALFAFACHGGPRTATPASTRTPAAAPARNRTPAAPVADQVPAAPPIASAADLPAKWWEQGDAACPQGAHLVGAAPPDGMSVSCKRNQEQDGPYVWFYASGAIYQLGVYKNSRQDGEWVSYHENGNIASRTPFVDGQYHGEEVSYYPSGKLMSRATWVKGQISGSSVTWHENGLKSAETPYRDGTPHGVLRQWNDRGKLLYEANYAAGSQDGVQTYFHDNGEKRTEQHYTAGALDGSCKQWSATGTLLGSFEMIKGSGLYQEWHDNGVKSSEAEMRNGNYIGKYNVFYENGQIAMQGMYKESTPIGEWVSYNVDGSISRRDIYKTEGQESIEYELGKMKRSVSYSRGSELRIEGEFVDDKRHGEWKYLDNWGDVRQIDVYKRGKLVKSVQKDKPKLPAAAEVVVGIEVCDNLLYRTLSCDAVPYDQRRSLVESAKWWKQALAAGTDARAQITESCRSQSEWVPQELSACATH